MEMQNSVRINRKHKDSSFRYIFHQKENALMLYNAINESNYQNPDELVIYTMENFVYIGMKNDLSFLIQDDLNVFEHQSTQNPNMPIRGLLYTVSMLKKYIDLNNLDIYASKLQHLPVPRYCVFYNGLEEIADTLTLRLTDSMDCHSRRQSSVEFTAHVININLGHNHELMERCPILYEYAVFIATIREYQNSGMTLSEAANLAVDDCISKGILTNILRGNKAEVTDIMLSEYNEALHIATEKEISYQDGYKDGIEDEKKNTERERLRAAEASQRADEAIQYAAKTLIHMYREIGIDQAKTISKLCSGLNIDNAAAKELLEKYWTN